MMKKVALLSLAVLALSTVPLFAAAPACYTFDCTAGQTCTFNASCSTATPIWRVWYDFGDGTTSGHVSNTATVSHTYATRAQGGPPFPSVKLTVIPWVGPIISVTCQMPVNWPFGPPPLPTGTCQ
jgi:hypothetical protein